MKPKDTSLLTRAGARPASTMATFREVILVVLILLVASFFRLYHLEGAPPGLQHDEIFDSNFALSILAGERPIFFEANNGVLPFFMYLVAVSFRLFGPSLWSLRTVAVACGLGSLILSYLLMRELFGRGVALLTLAGLSLSFWHIFNSRVGLEPITLPLLEVASFYLFWLGFKRGSALILLLAGLLLGVSTYTYHSSPLVPLTLLLFLPYLLLFHRKRLRTNRWGLALMLLVAFLVFAPLGHYVLTRPQTSAARVRDLSYHLYALRDGDPGPVLKDMVAILGMFGVRGDPEWRYNVAGRPVFDPLMALLFYAGVLLCIRQFREAEYAFLLLWLPVNLLASAVTPPSPSFLRAVGAITAVYAMPAITLMALWRYVDRRWGSKGLKLLAIGISALLAVNALSTYYDYFLIWARNEEVREIYRADLAEVARYLDRQEETGVICLSAQYAADLDQQALYLVSNRQWSKIRWHDAQKVMVFPQGAAEEGVTYIFPATNQPAGEAAQFFDKLPASEKFFDPQGELTFVAYHLSSQEFSKLDIPQPQQALSLALDDKIELLGYDLNSTISAGGNLHLALYWRVINRVPGDRSYAFFTHLVDRRGYLWAQQDAAGYPPFSWQEGDLVVQWFDLLVPYDAPPLPYEVKVGVYDKATGERLPIVGAGTPLADNAATLGAVDVIVAQGLVETADLEIANPSQVYVGEALLLLGYDLSERVVEPGRSTHLTLHWQVRQKPDGDYSVVVNLVDEAGKVWPQGKYQPLGGDYPTSRWGEGQMVRDRFDLRLDPHTPAGLYELKIGLYDEGSERFLPVVSETGEISLGPVVVPVVEREFTIPPMQHRLETNLGDQVTLLGYDLSPWRVTPSSSLHLTLYWQARREMGTSYTVFTHLLDQDNRIWGQKDSIPRDGTYPTTSWVAGEVIVDEYEIVVNPEAPPGHYLLEVGMYNAAAPTLPRLPVLDSIGQTTGDRILLGEVTVVRE